MCFGCGPENPAGLGLRMRAENDGVSATLRLDDRHAGAPGLAHGGVVAAAFDDLFGGLLVVLETPAVTANLNVDFRAPVPLAKDLTFRARCSGRDGRKLRFEATLEMGHVLLAQASALFVRVDVAHFESSGAPVPPAWREWGSAPSGSAA